MSGVFDEFWISFIVIASLELARIGVLGSLAAASQRGGVGLLVLAAGKHSSSVLPAARRHPLPDPATYPRELLC